MKKQIMIWMLVFLLVGSAIAVGVSLNDRDIDLTPTQKQDLESINLGNYLTIDYQQGDLYKRCLNKQICVEEINEVYNESDFVNVTIKYCENVLNTCSGYMKESDLDDWEEDRIKNIVGAIAERRLRLNETKVSEGTTTIKESK